MRSNLVGSSIIIDLARVSLGITVPSPNASPGIAGRCRVAVRAAALLSICRRPETRLVDRDDAARPETMRELEEMVMRGGSHRPSRSRRRQASASDREKQ